MHLLNANNQAEIYKWKILGTAGQIWGYSPPFNTGNTRVMSTILKGDLTWLWVNFPIELDRKKTNFSYKLTDVNEKKLPFAKATRSYIH